ncbi:ferredoxin--NADP reductase [Calditrichota bacterium]
MLKIDSQIQKSIISRSHKLNARIINRQDLTNDLTVLKVLPLKGAIPEFTAGQFINLGIVTGEKSTQVDIVSSFTSEVTRIIRRAYSICSAPLQEEYIEFLIDLVPHGSVTPVLWQLDSGDKLWMEPRARGRFTLENIPRTHNLIMICTGTGVAPFVSMLRRYKNSNNWKRFVLIQGAKIVENLAYFSELEAIAKEETTVAYYPLLSREPSGSSCQGRRGRVQELFRNGNLGENLELPLDPDKTDVFICGNSEMIESIKAILQPYGFRSGTRAKPGNIHTEKYW